MNVYKLLLIEDVDNSNSKYEFMKKLEKETGLTSQKFYKGSIYKGSKRTYLGNKTIYENGPYFLIIGDDWAIGSGLNNKNIFNRKIFKLYIKTDKCIKCGSNKITQKTSNVFICTKCGTIYQGEI